MSKVVTSRISDEAYDAFMMVASETGEHTSRLIEMMIDKFVDEKGKDIDVREVRFYRAYMEQRDKESLISQVKYLISSYQKHNEEEKLNQLREMCNGLDLDMDKIMEGMSA